MSVGVDALFRRAVTDYRAGEYELAANRCREVLSRNRRHPRAMAMLGQILTAQSNFQAAEEMLRESLAVAPRESATRALLAELYLTTGRHEEALAQFDRALAGTGDSHGALAGKAETLRRMGREADALAILRPMMERGDANAGMAAIYARLLRSAGEVEEAMAVIDRHLDAPQVVIRRMLLSELARCHEHNRDYDEAFAAYRRCNELSTAPSDADRLLAQMRLATEFITRDVLATLPRSTIVTPRPIFIVGMPRSGSTLIEQILAAHPDVQPAGETPALHRITTDMNLRIGSIQPYPACVADLDAADVDALAAAYLNVLTAIAPEARCFTDKHLGNFLHLGAIAALFPQATIIHSRRHPLDTCLSCYFQRFGGGVASFTEHLEDLGRMYAGVERLMTHWQDIGVPVLNVQYEDVVADLERETRRILDHCELEWHAGCLRYYETDRRVLTMSQEQVNKPIYSSSVRRYRHYDRHLEGLKRVLDAEGVSIEDAE